MQVRKNVPVLISIFFLQKNKKVSKQLLTPLLQNITTNHKSWRHSIKTYNNRSCRL